MTMRDRVVGMANQIAANLQTEGDKAPEAIANHIRMFWDPRMREQIKEYLASGGEGLSPDAREAVKLLSS